MTGKIVAFPGHDIVALDMVDVSARPDIIGEPLTKTIAQAKAEGSGREPRYYEVERATIEGNPHLTDEYKASILAAYDNEKAKGWLTETAHRIEVAIAARLEAIAHGPIAALAYDLVLNATMAFAPHHVGGAPLLFRPAWAPWFEKDHPGWCYEEEVLRGRGAVYFPIATGMRLWERLVKGVGDVKPFSRRGQGGEFETICVVYQGQEMDVVRFVPDKAPYVEGRIVVPGGTKPKRLVLPNGVRRAPVVLA